MFACVLMALVAVVLPLMGDEPVVIEAKGGGESRKDLPQEVTLKSDAVYAFEYSARSDVPAHCLAGCSFAAMGASEPGDGVWRERRTVFRTPSRGGDFPVRFHFGEWMLDGRIEAKGARIVELEAKHLEQGGLVLGGGERLVGNDYLFSFPFGAAGRNAFRPLDSFECPINGRLWWPKAGSRVVWRHELNGRQWQTAAIFVGPSDWTGGRGEVTVEVSSDRKEWTRLGSIATRRSLHAKVPEGLLPAKTLFVRFTGERDTDLQVVHYNFKAEVDGSPVRVLGRTQFVRKDGGGVYAEIGPSFFDGEFGETLARTGAASVWSASSGRKVLRESPVPSKSGARVRISTAANEAESAQLVVNASSDLEILGISAEGLPFPVDIKKVGYVKVRHPTDYAGLPISVPDRLLEPGLAPIVVPSGNNQPFWLTVKPPKGVRRGIYKGSVSIRLKEGTAATVRRVKVPIEVEVFGFTLPDTLTCETAFGLTPSLIAKAQGIRDWSPELHAVTERYYDVMAANHLSPYMPAYLDGWKTEWTDGRPTFDFTAFDAAMEKAFTNRHFNSFMVPLPGLGECSYSSRRDPEFRGHKPGDGVWERELGAYLDGVYAHLKEKQWLDRAYVYVYDEPRQCDFDLVRDGYRFVERHMPGIRKMLPSISHATFAELGEEINLWCPQIQYLDSPNLRKQRMRGDRIWWYVCNNPKAPYVCDFVDHPAPELRIWLWQTWKEKVGGILIWDVFNWRADANGKYDTTHPDQNGEGRFLYPGATPQSGPVESIRLTHLRDGLEDYEYFALLQRLDAANRLLKVPETVVRSMVDYNPDPSALEAHRVRLAHAIEMAGERKVR